MPAIRNKKDDGFYMAQIQQSLREIESIVKAEEARKECEKYTQSEYQGDADDQNHQQNPNITML